MSSLIGQTLAGRYRVDSTIGRGGMADVYQAWDVERSTYLALKLLHNDLAQDQIFLRRFKREAQTLAKLQHPNIVRFYGLEQDGRLAFILMDYIDGDNLQGEIFDLQGVPMPPDRILEIMRPVCGALHYAHRQGFAHCDLKPGNVLIHKNYSVLLSDFGIARLTDAATMTMVGMGTPAYMAPELVRGQEPVPASDIYSLGVILFEMLTGGERPFTGERATITGSTSAKVRWEQTNLEPPSLKRWYPDISPELDLIVQRCLVKDPRNRYRNALDLMSAMETAIASMPTYPKISIDISDPSLVKMEPRQEPELGLTREIGTEVTISKKTMDWKPWIGIGVAAAILLVVTISLLNRQESSPHIVETADMNSLVNQNVEKTQSTDESVSLIKPTSPNPTLSPIPIATPSLVPITRQNVEQIQLLSSFRYGREGTLSPDLKWVATVIDDSVIWVREVNSSRVLYVLDVQFSSNAKVRDRVGSLILSPLGDKIAFSRGDMVPQVWNLSDDTVHDIYEAKTQHVDFIDFGIPKAWSTDGRLLAIAQQGWIWIWDATTMKVVNTLITNPVNDLAWSPADTELAIGCMDNTVRIWDTETWSQSHVLSGHDGNVYGVAWSPDGSLLASASDDGDVRIWDVERGETIERIEDLDEIAFAVDWSPDGELIAIGGGDPWESYPQQSGYVRVWDLSSLRLVKELDNIKRLVESIAWSHEGSILAATDSEGNFRTWGVGNSLGLPDS